ncbi:MAG TPA: hypothetical protein VGE16_07395 [Albitalea sp.]
MATTEAADSGAHVRRTRHFLDQEVKLDRLLALTFGRADPGQAAFDLVAPILWRRAPTNWAQLSAQGGLTPAVVLRAADTAAGALAGLGGWSAEDIDEALQSAARDLGVPRGSLDAVLSVFVLHGRTPLPLAPVFEALGEGECMARLQAAARAYRVGGMVG